MSIEANFFFLSLLQGCKYVFSRIFLFFGFLNVGDYSPSLSPEKKM